MRVLSKAVPIEETKRIKVVNIVWIRGTDNNHCSKYTRYQ